MSGAIDATLRTIVQEGLSAVFDEREQKLVEKVAARVVELAEDRYLDYEKVGVLVGRSYDDARMWLNRHPELKSQIVGKEERAPRILKSVVLAFMSSQVSK